MECDDEFIIVQSNGIPNFEFVEITPNALSAQDYTWYIPLNPIEAEETTAIPLLNAVAIAVNGLPIFGPNEAPRDEYGDPFLDGLLDYCNGHTAPGGVYHFHARPECLFEDAEGNTSLVLGYAFDGYPILAPYICLDDACTSVKEVQSSWQRTQDIRNAWEAHEYIAGSGDLDECNGMVGPDGSYRYYATDTFPYFLGCYHGISTTANEQNQGSMDGANGQAPQDGQNDQPPQDGQGTPPSNGQPPSGQPPQGGQGNTPPPPPNGNNQPPRRQ